MKINRALTGEIKWGTGGERAATTWLKGRGDMEDREREGDEEEESVMNVRLR